MSRSHKPLCLNSILFPSFVIVKRSFFLPLESLENMLFLNIRYQSLELYDGDKGKRIGYSVSKAVRNINDRIAEALIGMDPTLQSQIDHTIMDLDKTDNKVCILSLFSQLISRLRYAPALQIWVSWCSSVSFTVILNFFFCLAFSIFVLTSV